MSFGKVIDIYGCPTDWQNADRKAGHLHAAQFRLDKELGNGFDVGRLIERIERMAQHDPTVDLSTDGMSENAIVDSMANAYPQLTEEELIIMRAEQRKRTWNGIASVHAYEMEQLQSLLAEQAA